MDALFNDADEFSTRFLSQIFEFCEPSVLASLSLCCKRYQLLAFAQLKSSDVQRRLEDALKGRALQFYVMLGQLAAFPEDGKLLRNPARMYCWLNSKTNFCCLVTGVLRAAEVADKDTLFKRKKVWGRPFVFISDNLMETEKLVLCDEALPLIYVSRNIVASRKLVLFQLNSFHVSAREQIDEKLHAKLRLRCLFHAYRYEFIMH